MATVGALGGASDLPLCCLCGAAELKLKTAKRVRTHFWRAEKVSDAALAGSLRREPTPASDCGIGALEPTTSLLVACRVSPDARTLHPRAVALLVNLPKTQFPLFVLCPVHWLRDPWRTGFVFWHLWRGSLTYRSRSSLGSML